MQKTLLATGIALSSCLISIDANAASFTGLNIFGDSLVDSGNLFNATDALLGPLGLPAAPPSPPYAQLNSNGPIWIDNVADALGLSPTLVTDLIFNPTTTAPPTQGINFALAGALSSGAHILDDDVQLLAGLFPDLQAQLDTLPIDPVLGFLDQIDAFTALSTIVPVNPEALNVIWVGGNDYSEAFVNPDSLGDLSLEQLPDFVTDNIIDGLTQLSSLGAQDFLVVNLPDLGETPFADFVDAQTPEDIPSILNQLTFDHNELLSTKLSGFSESQPNANIVALDVNTLFADAIANPDAFGLTNVTDTCLINFQPGFIFDGICDNPEEFLFFDDIHPTTTAYEFISDFALAALNETPAATSVPEPSSLVALITMGLLSSGTLLAKSQKSVR